MKSFKFGKHIISEDGPCFIIAEIGHNHQGQLGIAKNMIKTAAECGANAVKFQKRDNKNLYTKAMYNKPYDNENSFGLTYGEHREFLEFNFDQYQELKKCAGENGAEFLCTPFDFNSVDFLEKLGIDAYKTASGDLTNLPLLEYIAKLGKPMFVSTGCSTLEEIGLAYETILKYNDKLCLLHNVASYPAEYEDLNLQLIQALEKEFPKAVIGFSSHDNGILAPVIAYLFGARVIEKHFTINHAWKGTDHKFSLEPIGLRKQIRDLRRVDISLGDGVKKILPCELDARIKMGKSLYTKTFMSAGHVLSLEDIVLKSPGGGLPPYYLDKVVGKKLKVDLPEESMLNFDHFEDFENIKEEENLFNKKSQRGKKAENIIGNTNMEDLIRNLKMVVFDFDGVFTDNKVFVLEDGKESVVCWRGDGLGLEAIKNLGIKALVISTEINPIVSTRCQKLNLQCSQNSRDKLEILKSEAAKNNISLEEVAYMGNDINDTTCLRSVGLPVCVADSHPEVLQIAKYVTKRPGGHGAVREFCDLIVKIKNA